MLLDALMQEDEESVIDYAKLKEKAHDRETWRQWERTCLWAENTNNVENARLDRTEWKNAFIYMRAVCWHNGMKLLSQANTKTHKSNSLNSTLNSIQNNIYDIDAQNVSHWHVHDAGINSEVK